MNLTTETKESQIDDLLDKICRTLQLNEDRKKKVEARYKYVASWIEKDEGIFQDALIFPQGSYSIGTVVKPRNYEEYDLDFVVQGKNSFSGYSYEYVLLALYKRILQNDNYKGIVELKSRCVRIVYADDFHMDIIPASPLFDIKKNVLVPDRKVQSWVLSNPSGYIDWFQSNYIEEEKIFLRKYFTMKREGGVFNKSIDLPEDRPYEVKQPLQRAVQLIKRFRDIIFEPDEKFKPSSIVLTTICARYYREETSIYDTINGIVNRLREHITNYQFQHIKVVNPVNLEEDFTRDWGSDPRYYENFRKMVSELNNLIGKFQRDTLREIQDPLKKSFGENVINKAFENQATELRELRRNQLTGINTSTGIITSRGNEGVLRDRKNLFYGEKDL